MVNLILNSIRHEILGIRICFLAKPNICEKLHNLHSIISTSMAIISLNSLHKRAELMGSEKVGVEWGVKSLSELRTGGIRARAWQRYGIKMAAIKNLLPSFSNSHVEVYLEKDEAETQIKCSPLGCQLPSTWPTPHNYWTPTKF